MTVTNLELRKLLGVHNAQEWLTAQEIADRFRFPTADAARKWLHRHHVPMKARGRLLLIDPRDVEATMTIVQKRAVAV